MNDKPFNVIEAECPEFYEWLKEICRLDKVEDFIVPDYKNGRISVKFYTKNNRYNISIRLPRKFNEHIVQTDENDIIMGESNAPIDNGYMGCQVQTRKPIAGENWNRGNDLPDGKYCKETWDRIKHRIIAYELVKVKKMTVTTGVPVDHLSLN